MKSVVVDTNAFLRFLLNDIPGQADKVAWLFNQAKLRRLNIWVPQIVIFEVMFALEKYYKFPKGQVIDKMKTILSSSYLKIQDAPVFREALILFEVKNVDFVDCFLLCSAQEKEAEFFTFDKKLQ